MCEQIFHWYYTQLFVEKIKLFNDFVEYMYGSKCDNLKILCTYIYLLVFCR